MQKDNIAPFSILMAKLDNNKHTILKGLKQLTQFIKRKSRGQLKSNRISKTPLFKISSISSFEGGSHAVGTDFETPFGTQEMAAIIL